MNLSYQESGDVPLKCMASIAMIVNPAIGSTVIAEEHQPSMIA